MPILAAMLLLVAPTPTPRRPPHLGFAEESRAIVVTGARTEQAVGDSAVATQVIRRDAIEASGAETSPGCSRSVSLRWTPLAPPG